MAARGIWKLVKEARPSSCGNCHSTDNSDLMWTDSMEWFLCGDCRKQYREARKASRFERMEQAYHVRDIHRLAGYHTTNN